MVVFAMIARLSDGLPLSASTDLDEHERAASSKRNGKLLARKVRSLPSNLSMESGEFVWHVVQSMGVCFMALADYDYPQVLVFCFLDELQHEFGMSYDTESVQRARRPYCFIDFDGFLQKCKQRYLNPQSLHTRVPVAEMSRRLEEQPPTRMSTGAVLGSAAASVAGSSTAAQSSRTGHTEGKKSTIGVKLLVAAFSLLLILSALYRYHLALEFYSVDRLESEMPLLDVVWSVLSVAVGSLLLLQCFTLACLPSWAVTHQRVILIPLVILLAALCCFGDWIYVLLNICNASMCIGVAELTRSRSPKHHTLKQSA
ncbi:vesicle-trafficking protein SEC22a-like [Sycon ciliatum]|uniref:vesicle-trafficking protein SEC22a-like n=1 Tax=Sycon ciliatum TaxID=27933 RepID=UPI0020ADEF42|eukprot:scpid60251/ scgid21867/ Vesicle-trafficking protein SEC22a; SEC22 vesicle-trafficking protein homolog A; SEC22 vesicle-trafficking protein-like 2